MQSKDPALGVNFPEPKNRLLFADQDSFQHGDVDN